MRAAGAKRCVLLGIIIDTEANKDKGFFFSFFLTTVLRFGNEIDCGTVVVRCFSIVPTTCLQSKYTPSPSIIVFIIIDSGRVFLTG